MKQSLVWTSHRGLHKNHTENSLEAFRAAYAQGFRSFETDLRCTLDGKVILCHDVDVKRVARSPLKIHQSTYDDLNRLRLLDGQQFCTLDILLNEFPDVHFIFDIKEESAIAVANTIKSNFWSQNLQIKCRFLFWSNPTDRHFRQTLGTLNTMSNRQECWMAGLSALTRIPLHHVQPGKCYSLPPKLLGIDLYSQHVLKFYHDRGAKLLAFLPKTSEELDRALSIGVDEILTDGEIRII